MAPTNKVKARKPSKAVKPSIRKRKPSQSTKNHRFTPFSQRVSNLKIDPIRKRRNPEDQRELDGSTSTYFARSLAEWRDLNLSATFTAFAKEAAPLCDSLAVVLHNEERLMDLLTTYIDKGDGLALEPLLSLLSHFAHDLDSRFEKHFQRAISTVTAVAAKHSDPAVVEWSFNCLAWLFKYLSRLLIPDLRPLYNLMAPYLGKQTQKPFIVRFAAESMSYLVRKAAARYQSDAEPLDAFIRHAFHSCDGDAEDASSRLLEQGISTLLTESIKGVQSDVHSSGLFVLQSMLKTLQRPSDGDGRAAMAIIKGTLTSLIHHTDSESFRPIQDTITAFTNDPEVLSTASGLKVSAELLFTAITVRKGTRISDWADVVKALQRLVDTLEQDQNSGDPTSRAVLAAVAIGFQSATLDAVHPALHTFDTLRTGKMAPSFLHFCDLFSRLDRHKFQTLLLPQFQKFLLEQCKGLEDDIFLRLPKLLMQDKQVSCSDGLQEEIVRRLRGLAEQSRDNVFAGVFGANLALNAAPYLTFKDTPSESRHIELKLVLREAFDYPRLDEMGQFAVGSILTAFLDTVNSANCPAEFWPSLCFASPRFLRMERFWSNLLRYSDLLSPQQMSEIHLCAETLEEPLLKCLSMPSHTIRLSALGIIKSLYRFRGQQTPNAIEVAISIESTQVSFETSRSISMNIRKLASGYSDVGEDEFLVKSIPSYCLGLLNFQLSQAWTDATNALSEMSKIPIAEEVIISKVASWLEAEENSSKPDQHGAETSGEILNSESTGFHVVSDFECSNLAKVSAICEQVFEAPNSGYLSTQEQFRSQHACVPDKPQQAREKALQVLTQIPSLAEKRSRMLVPFLLRWAGNAKPDTVAAHPDTGSPWTRKEQKLMLSIFAKFANPRVLFKATEVYGALLNLCANGDVEIQRSALNALFIWKDPHVNQYEEHLTNLLDEARFSEELSVFLQGISDDGENAIDPEHHANLMPILLRLLYGRAVAASKGEQSTRRKAIFVALSSYNEDVLGMFVDIVLKPTHELALVNNGKLNEQSLTLFVTPLRQQLGMVTMLESMLETLGTQLDAFGISIVNALLLSSVPASRQLDSRNTTEELQDLSLIRSLRQTGIQGLARAFVVFSGPGLSAHAKIAVNELIAPRLEKFASENTQSISGVLRLMAAWASSPNTHRYLLDFQKGILDAIALLLSDPNTKDNVRLFVLEEIVDKLLSADGDVVLAGSQVTVFVRSLSGILVQNPAKHILDACVSTFTKLSGQVQVRDQAEDLIQVCSELLIKPNKAVSSATKVGLLKIVLPLLSICEFSFHLGLYNAICGLFSRFHELESRMLLSNVLLKLSEGDPKLYEAARICQDLNAVGSRLDDADHVRREKAFAKIYESYDKFSPQQWPGIIHSCLFYVRDPDDLVNRTSASRALERFLDAASLNMDELGAMLSTAVFPGIVYGMKNLSELVRAEYLNLLGHLVERFPAWSSVKDMTNLTARGDEEASFFTNILHIQQHRRLRALRRLSDTAGEISSRNTTSLFIPLLEHFVFEQAPGDTGRTLADQTILTLGALSNALSWSSFKATFRRYAGLLGSETQDKVVLRLLSALVEGRDGEQAAKVNAAPEISSPPPAVKQRTPELTSVNALQDMLTPLTDYLHHKDESTVDRRMPVAVTVVRMLKWLPEEEFSARLPPILTDVSHVLRSRSQEARDQTRKTLCQIVALIGPSYFKFVLKELRGALQRGYQLHVLSFTVHAMLIIVINDLEPGDLNECLSELVSIVMDDIFGVTGQEKDAEDYKSTMKEVKSSKSYDTMELLATITPIRQLGLLMKPLQALLSERLNTKMLRKVDDLLTRLRKGIDRNTTAHGTDILVLCHEIVNVSTNDAGHNKPRATNQNLSTGNSTAHSFRIISFALDLLRKVLRRYADLATAPNLAGFLPALGNALVAGQGDVQLSALKLLASIMKVPLDELDSNAPVYVGEAVRHIRAATDMTADSAKAGLELVTAVLRDRPSAHVREKDLADITSAVKGSIDEPDRQGIIYKFLRAILSRKVMITEVYEVMDEVGRVMVTNADHNIRESARGAYLQFLLEYPQTQKRWKKHSETITENLQYQHSTGRQSAMELLYQLLAKAPKEMFSKLASKIWLPLVLVQNSDQNTSCRDMARLLLGRLFEAADDDQINEWLTLLDTWLLSEPDGQIQVAALQCWSIMLRVRIPSELRVAGLRDSIERLLRPSNGEEVLNGDSVKGVALETFETLADVVPTIAFAQHSELIWKHLDKLLSNETGVKLLGAYFSHLASISVKAGRGLSSLPLTGSSGLQLNGDDMLQKCYSSLRVLSNDSENLSEGLRLQTIRNLVFLGRCFAANGLQRRAFKVDNEAEEDSNRSALGYLFDRLSYIIRQENTSATCRGSAIDCETALLGAIETVPNVATVLRPLYTLSDPSVPQSEPSLTDKARELMDLIQKRIGKEAYISALGVVQTGAKERRSDRRAKRKIELVTRPGKRTKVK